MPPLSVKSPVKRNFTALIDLVLPPRCPVSGEIVEAQGMVSATVWKNLSFIVAPLCARCGLPFETSFAGEGEGKGENTSEDDMLLCLKCQTDPPPFRMARAALRYDAAGRDLVLAFKHGDKTQSAATFTPWLLRAGAPFLQEADALIPVPLHPWRLLRRRYNQSCIMAKYIADRTGLTLHPHILRRHQATPSQGKMNARQRDKNVHNAFSVPAPYANALRGKSLILIDDVYTTGATARACTQALLQAGARQVDILTLARVVRAA